MTIKFSPRKAHFINMFAGKVIEICCQNNKEFHNYQAAPFLLRMFAGFIHKHVPKSFQNTIQVSIYFAGAKGFCYSTNDTFSAYMAKQILNNRDAKYTENHHGFDLHCTVHEWKSNLNKLPNQMWINWIDEFHNSSNFKEDWELMINQLRIQIDPILFEHRMELRYEYNEHDIYPILSKYFYNIPYLLRTIDTSYFTMTLYYSDSPPPNPERQELRSQLPDEFMQFMTKAKTVFSVENLTKMTNKDTKLAQIFGNEFEEAEPYLLRPSYTSSVQTYYARRALFQEWIAFWFEDQRLTKLCAFFNQNPNIPPYIMFEMLELFAINVLSTEDAIIFGDRLDSSVPEQLIDELLNTTNINKAIINLNKSIMTGSSPSTGSDIDSSAFTLI